MNKYLVKLRVICEKTVYIEALDEASASEHAFQGKGVQIGQQLKQEKIDSVKEVRITEMEI